MCRRLGACLCSGVRPCSGARPPVAVVACGQRRRLCCCGAWGWEASAGGGDCQAGHHAPASRRAVACARRRMRDQAWSMALACCARRGPGVGLVRAWCGLGAGLAQRVAGASRGVGMRAGAMRGRRGRCGAACLLAARVLCGAALAAAPACRFCATFGRAVLDLRNTP